MKRIIIIGSAGAGKSTLARALHNIIQIEVIHLDLLFWKPGWIGMPKETWIDTQQQLIQAEEWIIDGNYQSTMDIRLNAADTIIFLDMPRLLCIWRVIKRHIIYMGRSRPDLANGCSEKITWRYLLEIWKFPSRERKEIIGKFHENSCKKQIIWLTSRKGISIFLKKIRIVYAK
jgi:adenylate kinase family enzyme